MNRTASATRHIGMLSTAFGPLVERYLADPAVIEIMLNPDGTLRIERLGHGRENTGNRIAAEQAANIIKLVAAHNNDIADADNPEVACELPGSGARFQGWLPPVVKQPSFVIRKRAVAIFSLDDYVEKGIMSASQAAVLRQAVLDRRNVIIAGGTSSGKTTLANALLSEIRRTEDRVFVLEDLPELQVDVEDLVTLRTSTGVTMRQLVHGCLRMRPDRIIIGEVRDGAALDLMKAWNTGHRGGICTLHANSTDGALARLEDLILEVVPTVPRRLLIEAVDLVAYLERDPVGQRRLTGLAELVGIDENGYVLRPLD
jgi:type IV secretion system protein VirB11